MRFRKIRTRPSVPIAPGEERDRGKRIRFRVLLLSFLALVTSLGLFYWYWQSRWVITTGRVAATQVRVATTISGRIASLHVREGDQVTQGQLIAKLDDEELNAELKRAEITLNQTRSRLLALEQAGLDPSITARIEMAQRELALAKERQQRALAEVGLAEVVRERARVVAERSEQLFVLRAITRDQWEKTVAEWQKAQAEHGAVQARLSEAKAAVLGNERLLAQAKEFVRYSKQRLADELALLRLEVQRTEAAAEQMRSRLRKTAIHAPRSGLVSWVPRRVGEVVDPNDVILTIMDPREVWIEAYVSGSVLSTLRDGMEAQVKIESLSDQYYRGRVSFFHPAERPTDRPIQVGPQQARSPSQLSSLIHTVKIYFVDDAPSDLRPEMLARIWIAKQ
jgi:HlyD family secretion protein